jgi:hypothetical protein
MHLAQGKAASLLAAGAALGAICAPAAIADPGNTVCEPGQIVIDGQCNTAPTAHKAPDGSAPPAGSTGDHSADHH